MHHIDKGVVYFYMPHTPIDFKAAATFYLGCSERHLYRLCSQHHIPQRYRFNSPTRGRVRVLFSDEVELLQSLLFRNKKHATPTA